MLFGGGLGAVAQWVSSGKVARRPGAHPPLSGLGPLTSFRATEDDFAAATLRGAVLRLPPPLLLLRVSAKVARLLIALHSETKEESKIDVEYRRFIPRLSPPCDAILVLSAERGATADRFTIRNCG